MSIRKKNPAPLTRRLLAAGLLGSACMAAAAQAQAVPEAPLERLPYTPSLDTGSMDRKVDPCEDFYQYACGGWIAHNPIPPDPSRLAVYSKMANENPRH